MGNKAPKCDFCGQTAYDGAKVVVGPNGANICEECAKQVLDIVKEADSGENEEVRVVPPGGDVEEAKKVGCKTVRKGGNGGRKVSMGRIPTPSELVAKLDEYVIGQDDTKKTLAVAVYNHYCRLAALDGFDADGKPLPTTEDELANVELDKSNVLMIGPTGCGKTMLAKTIAKILDVPFAIADATTLTEAGYVGEDVENIVRYAYNNADHDIERTKRAIIWVDEIDKIASKTQNVSITRDVSGEGVQQALLKIVEGTLCRFPPKGGRKHPDQELVEIDTSNILFICGGAFVGLDKIVEQRIGNRGKSIGFTTKEEDEKNKKELDEANVRPEDLVQFGLIPEFVGRLPIITEMKELTEDELMRVLTEPKNSLVRQYKKLLKMSNVDLTFDETALRKLAKRAIERKTGARGLRAEMEKMMRDIMFAAPDKRTSGQVITITEDMVKEAA